MDTLYGLTETNKREYMQNRLSLQPVGPKANEMPGESQPAKGGSEAYLTEPWTSTWVLFPALPVGKSLPFSVPQFPHL